MTVYGVTEAGFIIKPLSVIREEVQNAIRGTTDAGMVFSDRSSSGQMEAIFCDKIAEQWEVAQSVYASQYPDSANGFALDEVCSITGTTRDGDTKTVGAGQVELDAFTTLSTGAVAHANSRPSDRFVTTADAINNTATVGVWVDVAFEAETAGAIIVNGEKSSGAWDGDLDTIAEAASGWTGVQNAAAFTTGTDREEDDELRLTREDELEAQGSTNVDSIHADILRVDGVVDAAVYENDTDYTNALGLPPHSVQVVARGGADEDIAQALFDTKAAGIDTFGTISEVVTDTQGINHQMNFDYAEAVVLYIDIDVSVDELRFVGADVIKTQVEAYVESLSVGEAVKIFQIQCAASDGTYVTDFNTPGVELDIADPPVLTADWTMERDQYAQTDVLNIRVYIDGVLQT